MAKAQLTFKDIGITVSVPVGARVIDISDKLGSGIVYGCREGDCGTCLMKVVDGWENLSSISPIEDKLLRDSAAGKHYRIACQAQVLGDVTVDVA